jgi:SAM-dependent methyltransferase
VRKYFHNLRIFVRIRALHYATSPPTRLRLSISPAWFDFKATGRDQLEFLTEVAGLSPGDHFLDVACGVGRIAIPLSIYLDSTGRYDGFDVNVEGIAWCRRRISANDPRFKFKIADVRTDGFNPNSIDASKYEFEYPDSTLISVTLGRYLLILLYQNA